MAKLLLLLLLLFSFSSALLGINTASSVKDFKCLRSKGYDFLILPGYRSVGKVSATAVESLKKARLAGFKRVDLTFFPCVTCKMIDAETQVLGLVSAVKGQTYNTIWIDVRVFEWGGNLALNQNFLRRIVQKFEALGQTIGIFTNENNWNSIVGKEWEELKHLPLWYVNHDYKPDLDDFDIDFEDFKGFGGWQKPSIKQYKGEVLVCGVSVDLNYMPDAQNTDL